MYKSIQINCIVLLTFIKWAHWVIFSYKGRSKSNLRLTLQKALLCLLFVFTPTKNYVILDYDHTWSCFFWTLYEQQSSGVWILALWAAFVGFSCWHCLLHSAGLMCKLLWCSSLVSANSLTTSWLIFFYFHYYVLSHNTQSCYESWIWFLPLKGLNKDLIHWCYWKKQRVINSQKYIASISPVTSVIVLPRMRTESWNSTGPGLEVSREQGLNQELQWLEGICAIFWQRTWLHSAYVLRMHTELNFKVMD